MWVTVMQVMTPESAHAATDLEVRSKERTAELTATLEESKELEAKLEKMLESVEVPQTLEASAQASGPGCWHAKNTWKHSWFFCNVSCTWGGCARIPHACQAARSTAGARVTLSWRGSLPIGNRAC